MKKIIAVFLIIILSGCATQAYYLNSNASKEPNLDRTQAFFVYGIGQSYLIDAGKYCGGSENVAKIESQQSALNALVQLLTLGIYSPRQAKIYCTR